MASRGHLNHAAVRSVDGAEGAVHFSGLGTTLVSGISYHRFSNVDWRAVGILAGSGLIGAVLGSTFLASLDGEAVTPWIAGILLGPGVYDLTVPRPRR